MIKKARYISFLFFVGFFLGCSPVHKPYIDVDEIIEENNLIPEDRVEFVQRDSLKNDLYSNSKLDKALLILKDENNDTIVSYFGNGISNISRYELETKKEGLFLLIPHMGKTTYQSTDFGGTTVDLQKSNKEILYLDSLFCYRILPKNMGPKKVSRISNDSLIERAKQKFGLEGDFKMVDAPTLKRFTIAKDTLKDCELRISISTTNYTVEHVENVDLMVPLVLQQGRKRLYKDDITVEHNSIASTILDTISDYGSRIHRYHVFAKGFQKFRDNTKPHKVIKKEIWVRDKIADTKKLLLNISENDLRTLEIDSDTEYHGGIMTVVKPELFKYHNSEYFISLYSIDRDDDLKTIPPPLYHLDTVQWKMSPVRPYEPLKNKGKMIKSEKVSFLSGDSNGTVSYFLTQFEIVNVGNEFKLKQKM